MMTEFDKMLHVMAYASLQISQHPFIEEASFDNDNDSCEIIFTLKNGKTYVLKAKEDALPDPDYSDGEEPN